LAEGFEPEGESDEGFSGAGRGIEDGHYPSTDWPSKVLAERSEMTESDKHIGEFVVVRICRDELKAKDGADMPDVAAGLLEEVDETQQLPCGGAAPVQRLLRIPEESRS